MKFAKMLAVPAATIALSLATVSTFTGCEGDILSADTITIEKLGVPTVDSVEVLSDGLAHIHVSGSYVASEDFMGFAVYSSMPDYDAEEIDSTNLLIADTVDAAGGTSVGLVKHTLEVDIDDIDMDQTWYIASFDKKQRISQPMPAMFYSRVMTDNQVLNEYMLETVATEFTGLDVDNMVEVKMIEGDIELGDPVAYATNSGADVIVEKKASAESLLITPIGGAVVFAASEDDQFTDAEIKKLYDDSYNATAKEADVTLADTRMFTVFSQGRSVRDEAGATVALAADQNYFVITSAYDVARVVVKSTSTSETATLTVYKDSGKNAGLKIRAND